MAKNIFSRAAKETKQAAEKHMGDDITMPVSYTHLDVYKRQAILCSVATAAAVLPAAPVPVFADATKVVSIGNDLTDAQKKTCLLYTSLHAHLQ